MNLEFYTCIPTRLSVRVAASRDATRVNWWEISHIGSPDIFEDVNNKFTNHLRGHLHVTFVEVTLNSAIAKLARRQCFVVPRSFLMNCAKLPAKKNVFSGGGGMGWHLVLSLFRDEETVAAETLCRFITEHQVFLSLTGLSY